MYEQQPYTPHPEHAGPVAPVKPASKVHRNVLLLLATVLVLSVSYYFVIALPSIGRARLDFDKQKYADEKEKERERARQVSRDAFNAVNLNQCLSDAEDDYWGYIKLNGKPVPGKLGAYHAPPYVWDDAAKREKAAVEECQIRYGSH